MKQTFSTRKLAYLGLMTALVFASNYARIVLPVSIGGNTAFTLANIVCALCGLLLGPVGGLASGLGSALYDLTNPLYAAECWITFLTKGALGLVAGIVAFALLKKNEDRLYAKYLTGSIAGCATYYVLYFLKTFLISGLFAEEGSAALGLTAIVSKIPASVFNAVIAIVVAPPLAIALKKALEKSGLGLDARRKAA
ncbi:MAG: ECF transporter S component [Clostridiales bacterium]|nr:ECF transporter S component [Clostridiales bacterium]